MNTLEDQLEQIEAIHQEYLAELHQIQSDEKQAIHEFLEGVRARKISEIRSKIQSEQNN